MHERACFNKIVTTRLHMEGGKSTQLRAHKQMTWTMVGNLLDSFTVSTCIGMGKTGCVAFAKTFLAQNLSRAMYTYTVAIHKNF